MKRALAAGLLSFSLVGGARAEGPPPAPAPAAAAAPTPVPVDQATCVFKTVHALPGGDGSMDPAINMLREDLRRPPFTAWKTFHVLGREERQLARGASATFSTPDGKTAELRYDGHVDRGTRHAIKAVLSMQGAKSAARTSLTLDEGGHFVVAGHKYQGGILIYAVTCRSHP